uniref:low-density lipoprotein receptor-related protein 11 isoform X2 n=1 Tax=Myxine glutinosa TaxID=7769 RepID=UPI00358F47B8
MAATTPGQRAPPYLCLALLVLHLVGTRCLGLPNPCSHRVVSVRPNTIVRPEASLAAGAELLAAPRGLRSPVECVSACCETPRCRLALLRTAARRCYLFACPPRRGDDPDGETTCEFSPHEGYTSFVVRGETQDLGKRTVSFAGSKGSYRDGERLRPDKMVNHWLYGSSGEDAGRYRYDDRDRGSGRDRDRSRLWRVEDDEEHPVDGPNGDSHGIRDRESRTRLLAMEDKQSTREDDRYESDGDNWNSGGETHGWRKSATVTSEDDGDHLKEMVEDWRRGTFPSIESVGKGRVGGPGESRDGQKTTTGGIAEDGSLEVSTSPNQTTELRSVSARPQQGVTTSDGTNVTKVIAITVPGTEAETHTHVLKEMVGGHLLPEAGVVLPLALGLTITVMLAAVLACRLVSVNRRLKRTRPLTSDESDYLINGGQASRHSAAYM